MEVVRIEAKLTHYWNAIARSDEAWLKSVTNKVQHRPKLQSVRDGVREESAGVDVAVMTVSVEKEWQ